MTSPLPALLVDQAAGLLGPLADSADNPGARDRLLQAMGWNLPALTGADPAALNSALHAARQVVTDVRTLLAGGMKQLGDAARSLLDLAAAVTAVADVVTAWRPAGTATPAADPPSADADPYLLFVNDLVNYLLDVHLANRLPRLRAVLDLIGVRSTVTPAHPVVINGAVARDGRARPFYDLAPLADLLRDPVGTVRTRIFGSDVAPSVPDDLADLLGPLLADWLGQLGLLASYGTPGAENDPTLTADQRRIAAHLLHVAWTADLDPGGDAALWLRLAAGLARDTGGTGTSGPLVAVLRPDGGVSAQMDSGPWTVGWTIAGNLAPLVVGRTGARFDPPAAAALDATLAVTYGRPSPGNPALRIGSPGATRLEIDQFALQGTLHVDAAGPDGSLMLHLVGAKLLVQAGDDGFLAAVLPAQPVTVDLDLGIGWSPRQGLTLRGAARLDRTFAVGYTLGPLTVDMVHVSLHADASSSIELRLSTDLTVRLGPVTAAVAGLGLRVRLLPAEPAGALGPLDTRLELLAPDGVGIAVDAGVVTGGGYLLADAANGQYAGVVALRFAGIALTAVGLLNTRMPDGSPGFSLLVLISTRFAPIQLGFGFSLTGVGGLIGVNRSVDTAALRAGLPNGSLSSVLFPTDVVGNAAKLIHDLGTFFPVTPGQYVVGPTVELIWGAQPILTAQLGLFIEFPSPARVILAGRLTLTLPPGRTDPPVRVQVDLLGVLDFAAQTLALDGVLRNSRIGPWTLTGALAVRAGWGANPAFLVSVGGFNPRFPAPAGFPVLPRLTLALGSGDNPRIRLSAYLALTSNTVQFGARLEVAARMSVFGVGELGIAAQAGFDALITLQPFSFIVDIGVAVALTWNGDPLMAVQLDITLTGPEPWHAVGTAVIHFLGTHTLHFEVTVGSPGPAALPVYVDLGAQISAALAVRDNWSAELPDSSVPLVTLADAATSGTAILAHPLGSLSVRQQVGPLERTVQRSGAALVRNGNRFTLTGLSLGNQPATGTPVSDYFAPGQYLELTDAQRVSAPSFERWTSGVRVDDTHYDYSAAAVRTVTAQFDTRIQTVQAGTTQTAVRRDAVSDSQMTIQSEAGAVAVNGVEAQGSAAYQGPDTGIAVRDPVYAVVSLLAPATGIVAELTAQVVELSTWADAREALAATAQAEPDLSGTLRVLAAEDLTTGATA